VRSRGISGFGVIFIIIILFIIGYIAFQIGRIQFTYGTISEKVENAAKIGTVQNDGAILQELVREAAEAKITLIPEQIWIDHSIPDSFRIVVEYDDSASIFGIFTYRRHLFIDKVEPIKVRF